MGVAERRAREKDAKRQKIMDAATELILSEGFDKLTIRKIADKLEYSPGVIYNYFEDKGQLLFDFCEETFERLQDSFTEAEMDALPPVQAFRLCGQRYIDFALENPAAYVITFCLPPPTDVDGWIEHEAPAGTKSYEILVELIRRCQESGDFRPMDTAAAAQVVWFAVHGLASMLILCHGHYGMPWASKEDLIRHTLDLVERGLR